MPSRHCCCSPLFVQAALLVTVPVGALGGGAAAAWLGNVPVLVASAGFSLLSAATLWLPGRAAEATGRRTGRRASRRGREASPAGPGGSAKGAGQEGQERH